MSGFFSPIKVGPLKVGPIGLFAVSASIGLTFCSIQVEDPNPRPSDMANSITNGMNLWGDIEPLVKNKKRPAFCIKSKGRIDGPIFSVKCSQLIEKEPQISTYSVFTCSHYPHQHSQGTYSPENLNCKQSATIESFEEPENGKLIRYFGDGEPLEVEKNLTKKKGDLQSIGAVLIFYVSPLTLLLFGIIRIFGKKHSQN